MSTRRVFATAPKAFGAFYWNRLTSLDVDRDGDLDVVTSSSLSEGYSAMDKLAWFENIDGMGRFGEEQAIATEMDGIHSLVAADINGDGHDDFLAASRHNGRIVWYEPKVPDNTSLIPGDADRDSEVAFADFLILTTNFGKDLRFPTIL